ncbi:HET-domain-containing protein [Hyaloscypha variabilis F]|uniref:HET-domain-containing protein n=1 Tax=Hyaloscypha variabilis (strain UAMH 11265 / GT02V1 / F) TaxID=1149755 RepID=A0A2J6S8U7_HYAVF|nr:HET-domain-containing protein [Hyaloscypha variabilis F]
MADILDQRKYVEKVCPRCKSVRLEEAFRVASSNTPPNVIYSPLASAEKQIRILKISSGFQDQPLECILEPVFLEDAQYTALSYCWGAGTNRMDIEVNGQSIPVTRNLENALRGLRKADRDMVVWADAICINQQDSAEKSVQVGMMGNIYAKATEVWIWLGQAADNSDFAMDYIRDIKSLDFEDPNYSPPLGTWKAIKMLWGRPWFERLWVVQEALLARKATFNCGQQSVDFDFFITLKEFHMKYRRNPDPRLASMQFHLSSPFGVALWDWNKLKDQQSKGGIPLFEMITMTGKAQCFSPVDKVYGILSVCQEVDRRVVQIDYDVCICCLLKRLALYMLLRREAVSPLLVLQTHQSNKTQSLPSWVPDYTVDDEEKHFVIPDVEGCTPFSAGANNAAWTNLGLPSFPFPGRDGQNNIGESLNSLQIKFEDEITFETLMIPGLIVDTLKSVYPSPFEPNDEFDAGSDLEEEQRRTGLRRSTFVAAFKEWEHNIQRDLPDDCNPYEGAAGRTEAFWRTLIADHEANYPPKRPVGNDFADRFEAWMGRSDREKDEAYTRHFSNAAIMICLNRSFVTTSNGYLALVPRLTVPGHLVCVLRGGNVPFILKSREDGYFELVGEAYVHGIMDGEFVRSAQKDDVRVFKIR